MRRCILGLSGSLPRRDKFLHQHTTVLIGQLNLVPASTITGEAVQDLEFHCQVLSLQVDDEGEGVANLDDAFGNDGCKGSTTHLNRHGRRHVVAVEVDSQHIAGVYAKGREGDSRTNAAIPVAANPPSHVRLLLVLGVVLHDDGVLDVPNWWRPSDNSSRLD
ncbi:hypothetical protein RvY_08294 [Ramazzottius varieornatus]|uniref:Uncharacterized protein n=1 Tax=Ramazzottius varieornatus TaxID=947166 RepID=A0A1D1VB22_RAMVA|nr:hypothetical protein RvY_08294 [Ramazzottius varieornatus]